MGKPKALRSSSIGAKYVHARSANRHTREQLGNADADRSGEAFQMQLISVIGVLRGFSHRLCRDRDLADDLVQEALCKGWEARDRFRPGSNVKAWLCTILRNLYYSHGRRAWRQQAFDEAIVCSFPAAENEQDWAAQLSDVVRSLRSIPGKERTAVLLTAGDFSTREKAAICNCPEGTVKTRTSRGRRLLLAAMEAKKPIVDRNRPVVGGAVEEALEMFRAAGRGEHLIR